MTIDRYKAHIVTGGKNVLVAHSDMCLYTDHEQAMAEKEARIAQLEKGLLTVGIANVVSHAWRIAEYTLSESPCVSLNNIKADAIDEMVRNLERDYDNHTEFNLWYDVRCYANKLRKDQ